MSHDGKDPPTPEPKTSGPRPRLKVIHGGAGLPSERPAQAALGRSAISPEGKDKLLSTLRALGGERAFLFVWDDREFTLREACAIDERGEDPKDRSVMWSLLDRITTRRTPLAMAGTDEQATDALLSGVTAPMRMAVAVPLLVGDALKAVACFDKRIHRGAFGASDARAAMLLLDRIGFEAGHVELLREQGVPAPRHHPTPRAEALLHALREALFVAPASPTAGLSLRVTLAAPSARDVSFWLRSHPLPFVERIVTCRLEQPDGDGELLVRRLLVCQRVLTQHPDAPIHEALQNLAMELTRESQRGFALHVTVMELALETRTLALWQAGDGAVLGVSALRGAEMLTSSSPPLTHRDRMVLRERRVLLPHERIVCSHGATPVLDLAPARSFSAVAEQAEREAGTRGSIWCVGIDEQEHA